MACMEADVFKIDLEIYAIIENRMIGDRIFFNGKETPIKAKASW